MSSISSANDLFRHASSSRRQPIWCERLQVGTVVVLPGAARPNTSAQSTCTSSTTNSVRPQFCKEDATTRSTKKAYFQLGELGFFVLFQFFFFFSRKFRYKVGNFSVVRVSRKFENQYNTGELSEILTAKNIYLWRQKIPKKRSPQ